MANYQTISEEKNAGAMFQTITLFLLFGFFLLPATLDAETLYSKKNGINVTVEPNPKATLLTKLQKDEAVELIESKGRYVKVRMEDQRTGWVYRFKLSQNAPKNPFISSGTSLLSLDAASSLSVHRLPSVQTGVRGMTPKQAALLLDKASDANSEGRYSQAVNLYTKIINQNQKQVELYWHRGNALYSMGKYSQAIADYQKATKLDPGFDSAFASLGWTLMMAGRFDEALAPCQKAYQLNRESIVSIINLGHAYLLTGSAKNARNYYRKAVQQISSIKELEDGPLADLKLFISKGWQVKAANVEIAWMKKQLKRDG
ncbi:MAG: tetratricopeptide repeat protein [Magnetococcales bacterium]|nr:tetratricopeptide repeat protein [Magnetococcales bacterium]